MKEDMLTENGKVRHWVFHPSRPYFYFDPEGDGFMYYATEHERNEAANGAMHEYLDDGWREEVERVVAGKVTHVATQTNRIDRPPPSEIDEDGCDGDGTWWDPDWSFICNYELKPADPAPAATVPERWRETQEKAIRRAEIFDDGSDGADAESAQSVVALLRGLLSSSPQPQKDES